MDTGNENIEIREPQSTMVVGRNLSDIPCFKTVFQAGIVSGLALGLGTFMLTSRVKRATDVGFFSFVGITLSYWFYCRYQYSAEKFRYQGLQHAMRYGTVLEGTDKTLDDLKTEDA